MPGYPPALLRANANSIPLNYLSSRLERRRREIEEATNHLELLVGKHDKSAIPEAVLTGHER